MEPDLTVEMTPEQMRAAINARQEHDVLRDGAAPATKPAVATDKNLLSSDPQLSAAVLLLRLELADAKAKT